MNDCNEAMENNLKETKEKPLLNNGKIINEMLMKPFELGWTREVVNRVIIKNGTPNCDIYYYSPSGKKIRSLIEAKSNLSEGLSPECFTFKKEILGLDSKYETVRDARIRKKGSEKIINKTKKQSNLKTTKPNEKSNEENTEVADDEKEEIKNDSEKNENDTDETSSKENEEKKGVKREHETENSRPQRIKKKKSMFGDENNKIVKQTTVKVQKKNEKVKKKISIRSKLAAKRKSVLKKIIEAKQLKKTKAVLPKIKSKKACSSKKKISVKSKKIVNIKNPKVKAQNKMKSTNNKSSENTKIKNSTEPGKRSSTSDLKSIVKQNIGKYREMREKQKLVAIKASSRKQNNKIPLSNVRRPRSEPLSKNRHFYLKPFEKGWRRELVFRSNTGNSSKQLADVYYFHPSGRKLRSLREISENLTPGLTIECFTFKKESLECGEPDEVVRNARTVNRN